MTTVLGLLLLGKIVSLAIYQMTWRNGSGGAFVPAGATATLLTRLHWWPLHAAMLWPAAGLSWDGMPALRLFATAGAVLLALGAVGRLGCDSRGRWFVTDRLLTVLLALAVPLAPGFLYPCVVACCCLQSTVASWRLGPGYSNLLGHEFMRGSLCVACAALTARGWCGIPEHAMLASVLAWQASTYVHHALAKSALGPKWHSWILENRPQCLVANAWLRGWTAGKSLGAMLVLASWVGRWRVAICAAAWIIEIGWITLLADQRSACALLFLTTVFHVVVFSLTGLFAWHYIANHVLWLVMISLGMTAGVFRMDHWFGLLASLPLSVLWVAWVRSGMLAGFRRREDPPRRSALADAADHLMAWWDTPLMRMFSFTVTTSSGRVFALPVPKLSPYDTAITDLHTHLMILCRHPDFDPAAKLDREVAATGVWGLVIDRSHRDFLYQQMDGTAAVPASWPGSAEPPWVLSPDAQVPRSAVPLRELFDSINRHIGRVWYRRLLRWPHFPGEDLAADLCPLTDFDHPIFRFDETILSVTVWRVRTFHDGSSVRVLSRDEVGTILTSASKK